MEQTGEGRNPASPAAPNGLLTAGAVCHVGAEGLEPPTCRVVFCCSIRLSYAPERGARYYESGILHRGSLQRTCRSWPPCRQVRVLAATRRTLGRT